MTTKQYTQKAVELSLDYNFFESDRSKAKADADFQAQHPTRRINVFERVSVDSAGIHVHFKGMKYPTHCFPFRCGVYANDLVKKYTMSLIHTFALKELKWTFLGFVFTSWKKKIKILETALYQYCTFADRTYNTVLFPDGLRGTIYLKEQYYSLFSREVMFLVSEFLQELGISENVAKSTGKIIGTMFEYDDAYRYRVEDIMSETDNFTFRSQPRSELKRLGAIMANRDHEVGHKFQTGIRLVRFALLSRKVRNAFRSAVFMSEFKNLQLDAADWYHVLHRTGYDYLGLTDEERNVKWLDIHGDDLPDIIEVP